MCVCVVEGGMFVCWGVCVCVCVCVRVVERGLVEVCEEDVCKRESERDRAREKERARERDRERKAERHQVILNNDVYPPSSSACSSNTGHCVS